MNSRILIVEDEARLREVLCDYFKSKGETPVEAGNGMEALELIDENEFDAVLLDIMMPELDGLSLCRAVRRTNDVPIIFLTALSDEEDKLLGYELGADDYVTKPFSFKELLSRIRANIRRSSGEVVQVRQTPAAGETITVGELVIDTTHYSVTKNGEAIELSKKDYDFIAFLAANAGKAYSREALLEAIWGYDDYYGDIRTVDVTVCRIRNKIEKDPAKPEYLMTKRGVGYFLAKR